VIQTTKRLNWSVLKRTLGVEATSPPLNGSSTHMVCVLQSIDELLAKNPLIIIVGVFVKSHTEKG